MIETELKAVTMGLTILITMGAVTSGTVTGTALPSANNNLEYKYYTTSFNNHCPLCGANDCLVWNPKGTIEGEWTCRYCLADYCAVTGADKSYNIRAYLTKTTNGGLMSGAIHTYKKYEFKN